MSWDAVSALGQVVGALAVVLTLVYLAVQIRQNTKGLRLSATAGAIAAVREWNYLFISDYSVRQTFRKGTTGLGNLSEDESAQFGGMTLNLLKIAENLHFQFLNGALHPAIWKAWDNHLSKFVSTVGCLQYYNARRQSFNPTFQDWMDSLVQDSKFNPFEFSEPSGELE